MLRHLLLGTAAAIAVLVVAFGGTDLVVHADGGGSISGRIIHDIDGDGDRADIDEPGLSNWRVELREQMEEGESEPVETRTDRNGEFSFDGLEPGDYSVSIPCEGQPHLWMATWPSSSTWYGVTIEEGSTPEPINYLLKTLDEPPEANGSISGRLTWDENRNALPEPSERGAAGWSLTASMLDMPQCFPVEDKQVTTTSDGSFSVSGLIPGTWTVGTARAPEGENVSYVLDYPGFSEQNTGWEAFYFEALVEVPEGGTGSVAMGILDVGGSASISGVFYLDKNQDGIRQAGEPLVVCQCFFGIMVRTPHGFAPFFYAGPPNLDSGAYAYSDLAGGEYLILASTSSPSPKSVTVAEGERLTDVDLAVSFVPDQTPTIIPESVSSTPEPGATPPPGTIGVSPPDTGSSGATSTNETPWVAAATALVLIGSAGVGYAFSRLRRHA